MLKEAQADRNRDSNDAPWETQSEWLTTPISADPITGQDMEE